MTKTLWFANLSLIENGKCVCTIFLMRLVLRWPLRDWTWKRGFGPLSGPFLFHPLSGSSSFSPSSSWHPHQLLFFCFILSQFLVFGVFGGACTSTPLVFLLRWSRSWLLSSLGIICGCGTSFPSTSCLLSLFSLLTPFSSTDQLFAVSPCSQF